VERAIRDCDAVINLAAICNPADYNTQPLAVIRANLFDVYPIVEICARYRRWLVSFSTSETYGRTLSSYLSAGRYDDPDLYELREDETPLVMGPIRNQRWTYACAKQMTERLIYAHHMEEGLPFTIIRPLNFFGPRMDYIPSRDGDGVPRVLACFMSALMSGEPMQLVDGGQARRTIVSIYEAVDAIRRVLERPDTSRNQIFNIGNPRNEVTIAELADHMRKTYAKITGDACFNHHPLVSTPAEQFYGAGYEDCDRRMPDIGKAERLLGWVPRMGLEDILLDTMQSYHDEYAASKAA
jgi:UDP-apiose/xylose synthase